MTCDVCGAEYDAASSMDHCATEGLCWEHCTDFAGHSSPAIYDEDEPDRAYDAAVDDALGAAIEAGEPENWKEYLR